MGVSWTIQFAAVTAYTTRAFEDWFRTLGNRPGDWKPVAGPVCELRIDYGPGYRVYFMRKRADVVILLTGGDKSSQQRDICHALDLAAEQERDT
jgi:putative component of toxin-antitoxin plasmid stabilization module